MSMFINLQVLILKKNLLNGMKINVYVDVTLGIQIIPVQPKERIFFFFQWEREKVGHNISPFSQMASGINHLMGCFMYRSLR